MISIKELIFFTRSPMPGIDPPVFKLVRAPRRPFGFDPLHNVLHVEGVRSAEIMTTIAHCLNVSEALSLRMQLEAAGIPAFIPDELSAGIAPYLFFTNSGVRVQVNDRDVEEAKKIINAEPQG